MLANGLLLLNHEFIFVTLSLTLLIEVGNKMIYDDMVQVFELTAETAGSRC